MKKYKIENAVLEVRVKETGAELCSIINKNTGIEHIWQANPDIWGSHSPVLFPIIGALKNNTYFFNEKSYEMPKHGIIRNNKKIRLKEKLKDKLVFELIYSEETLRRYPFKFNFQIAFQLNRKSLTVTHQLINLDKETIYFSTGGHPAFNICLYKNEVIDDYYIEFDQEMELKKNILSEEGLVTDELKPVLKNENRIRLTKNIFNNDALIFKDISSKEAHLVSKKNGRILSVKYTDFNNLGIWAKPGAPYVCIEPWLGIADREGTDQNLKNKEGIIKLMPSKEFEASYTIDIA